MGWWELQSEISREHQIGKHWIRPNSYLAQDPASHSSPTGSQRSPEVGHGNTRIGTPLNPVAGDHKWESALGFMVSLQASHWHLVVQCENAMLDVIGLWSDAAELSWCSYWHNGTLKATWRVPYTEVIMMVHSAVMTSSQENVHSIYCPPSLCDYVSSITGQET